MSDKDHETWERVAETVGHLAGRTHSNYFHYMELADKLWVLLDQLGVGEKTPLRNLYPTIGKPDEFPAQVRVVQDWLASMLPVANRVRVVTRRRG